MNKYIAAAAAIIAGLLSVSHANAQLAVAKVVQSCGTVSPTPHPGGTYALTIDITGTLCSVGGGGSFSWPGTAGNAQQGVNPGTGTMPYVNAINKAGPYISAGASTGQYGVSINSVTTLTVPSGTLAAEICVEAGTARYTDDGATPSSTVGIPVPAASGTPICWQVAGPALLSAFKIIGSGATIDVSYYK